MFYEIFTGLKLNGPLCMPYKYIYIIDVPTVKPLNNGQLRNHKKCPLYTGFSISLV